MQEDFFKSFLQEHWIADVKGKLNEREIPRDVAEAEALLKKHGELRDDINANRQK